MFKVDEILSNVIKQTLVGRLEWKFLSKNRNLSIFIAKKRLGDDKYLSFFLNVYSIGSEVYVDDITLVVELTTTRNTTQVKKMISDFYPRLVDLYYIIVNEILDI